MEKKPQIQEFWVTNISNLVITIGDLDLVIYPGRSYNLLNPKLGLSLEQVKSSFASGDLCKKKKMVIGSAHKQNLPKASVVTLAEAGPGTCRYFYEEIKEQNLISDDYQKLSDEKFVDELLEIEEESSTVKTKK